MNDIILKDNDPGESIGEVYLSMISLVRMYNEPILPEYTKRKSAYYIIICDTYNPLLCIDYMLINGLAYL